MSDPTNPTEGQVQDPIKNLKAEYDRKLQNTEQAFLELKKSNDFLAAQIASMSKSTTKESAPEEAIEDLWYSKPEVAAHKIKESAKAEIRKEIEAQNQVTTQRNTVLSQLVSEYPELNDSGADLTRKAVEIYSQLPEDEKVRPMAYRLAVKEAAAELGVKPASKRTGDEDYYTTGGSSVGATTRTAGRRQRDELDEKTAAFAAIMGVDPSKVKDRAKARKNWSGYE